MEGREDRKENDLFFTCSFLEYLGRKTKNRRCDVVNALGREEIERIYELADVYHSDNIERVSDDFIEKSAVHSRLLSGRKNIVIFLEVLHEHHRSGPRKLRLHPA